MVCDTSFCGVKDGAWCPEVAGLQLYMVECEQIQQAMQQAAANRKSGDLEQAMQVKSIGIDVSPLWDSLCLRMIFLFSSLKTASEIGMQKAASEYHDQLDALKEMDQCIQRLDGVVRGQPDLEALGSALAAASAARCRYFRRSISEMI